MTISLIRSLIVTDDLMGHGKKEVTRQRIVLYQLY